MFCPQCGTESSSGQQYCRSCGANLKFIGKAVSLSEAIARSDRGPLPKIKEVMQGLKAEFTQGPKAEQISEEVSGALDRMNKEILSSFPAGGGVAVSLRARPKAEETPGRRREEHIVKGTVSLFSGVALMIFLYFFSAALVLKLPPDVLAEIPFEVDPVARMIWLVGLIPALSGLGRLTAGLLIGAPRETKAVAPGPEPARLTRPDPSHTFAPGSVTDHTTELLDDKAPVGRAKRSPEGAP